MNASEMTNDCKEMVTNCNHLGNEAKMREALVKADAAFRRISRSAWFIDANFSETKEVMDAGNAVTSALSTPPRNCDAFSKDEVLRVLDDRSFSKEDTIEWLYEEAKGETK